MPFLRVLRDKRGYETTYLVHWFRDGNRQRSKVLYMFRTPPGVRVGRDPFTASVIREIEAAYPDIEFDWRALREHQQVVEAPAEQRRARRRREEESPPSEKGPAPPPAPSPAPRTAVPASITGATREEQIAFLATWYADLRERVRQRIHDPARLEALLALVERLNPSPWTTDEEATAGLQHASEALGRLSRVLSKRRRRSRRKGTAANGAPGGAPGAAEQAGAVEPGDNGAAEESESIEAPEDSEQPE